MKKLYLCLIMIALLAVSACGGGGGPTVPDPVPAKLEGLEGRWSLHIEYSGTISSTLPALRHQAGTILDEWTISGDKIYSSTHAKGTTSVFSKYLKHEYDGTTLIIPKLIVEYYYPAEGYHPGGSPEYINKTLELSIPITPADTSVAIGGAYKTRGSLIGVIDGKFELYHWDGELTVSGIMNKLPD